MVRKSGAGGLRQKLLFQKKSPTVDEFGNPLPGGDFETVFTDYGEFVPRNGGETVIASRLQGIQPYTVRVRSNSNTRQVTPDWRIVDARNDKRIFNIRTVTDPDQKNQYVEMLVDEGATT